MGFVILNVLIISLEKNKQGNNDLQFLKMDNNDYLKPFGYCFCNIQVHNGCLLKFPQMLL